jgi:hypothetical protein
LIPARCRPGQKQFRPVLAGEGNSMNRSVRVLAGLAILLAVLSAAGCAKLKARDQLNKGVQSYKNSRYEEATEHFKSAVSLDPSLVNARLYQCRQRHRLPVSPDEGFRPGEAVLPESRGYRSE